LPLGKRLVFLTQDMLDAQIPVLLERFQPNPGEATGYTWTSRDGTREVYDMPPYRISDMRAAADNVARLINWTQKQFTSQLLHDSNPIVEMVFSEAERFEMATKVLPPIFNHDPAAH
jgi:hypothetical protein